MFATYGRDQVAYAQEWMRPVVGKLIERAQATGKLRADFSPTDVPMIAFMLASGAEYACPAQRALWERYLTLIIDGLRPARDDVSPFPVPALSPQEMEQAMRAHAQRSPRR
jgi:hypothetical protein